MVHSIWVWNEMCIAFGSWEAWINKREKPPKEYNRKKQACCLWILLKLIEYIRSATPKKKRTCCLLLLRIKKYRREVHLNIIHTIIGWKLTKKNALGDWITLLDDNAWVKSPPLNLNQLLQQSQALVSLQTLQWPVKFVFLIVKMGRGFGTVYLIFFFMIYKSRTHFITTYRERFCSYITRTRFFFLSYMFHDMSGSGWCIFW